MSKTEDITAWGPRDYVTLPYIHPNWKFLDIGPGRYPHPRANVYVDMDPEVLKAIALKDGQSILVSEIEKGLPGIPDDAFDFVWISHVLEHCQELQKAVDALNRISKRGMMVVPSSYKDSLFLWEEEQHLWNCLPNPTSGAPPIFVEHNRGYISRLKDQMVQKAMCFLYRTGTHHDCTAERHLRSWYQEKEPFLDITYEWGPDKPLRPIIIR